MKKLTVLALVVAVLMTACASLNSTQSSTNEETESSSLPASSSSNPQLSNPFVDCNTLEEAETLAGFTVTLPDTIPNWNGESIIRAMENSMIEVVCKMEDDTLTIRKGAGTEDISGDYNSYETSQEILSGGKTITVKGNSGIIYLAIWTVEDYSFAVRTNSGFSQEEILNIISAVA